MKSYSLLISIENLDSALLKLVMNQASEIRYKQSERQGKSILNLWEIDGEANLLHTINYLVSRFGKDLTFLSLSFFEKVISLEELIRDMATQGLSFREIILKVKEEMRSRFSYLHVALETLKITMNGSKYYRVSDQKYLGEIGDEENLNHLLKMSIEI